VRSNKEECLDRMIFFGERSLRRATREYAAHYHEERNHQGIGNRRIEPKASDPGAMGPVRCSERLDGMLLFYHRVAASPWAIGRRPRSTWSAEFLDHTSRHAKKISVRSPGSGVRSRRSTTDPTGWSGWVSPSDCRGSTGL